MLQAKVLLLPTKKLARTTFYILSGKQEFSVYIKRSELKIDVAKNASFNSLSNHAMAKKKGLLHIPGTGCKFHPTLSVTKEATDSKGYEGISERAKYKQQLDYATLTGTCLVLKQVPVNYLNRYLLR